MSLFLSYLHRLRPRAEESATYIELGGGSVTGETCAAVTHFQKTHFAKRTSPMSNTCTANYTYCAKIMRNCAWHQRCKHGNVFTGPG